jgi:very-short-patch-repair endonuclease/predicted transcriptional regulator of viral defense system
MQVADGRDGRIAGLAARQYGVVSWWQLIDAGVSRGAIAHRLAHGRLHRVHRGVYLVGHPTMPRLAAEAAAVLACGEGAVLSHQSAAKLWQILDDDNAGIHVTVVGNHRRHPSIRMHRTASLDANDVARRHGLPLTSPARTLLDLSEVVSSRQLERAVEEAERRHLVGASRLHALLQRSPGRRGAAALRALLECTAGPTLTRSEAEERLLALVRAARLPHPELNVRVAGCEVDFLWRDAGLVVEVDGFAYHSTRAAFERDRRRDAKLQSAGFAVVRVTWRQILDEPEALVALLAQNLARPDQRLSSRQWR